MEDGKDIIILCTVWPDHTKELNKGIIAVDDSVSFQETKPWIKCSCKILESYPFRPCRTFKITVISSPHNNNNNNMNNKKNQLLTPHFLGLPILTSVYISKNETCQRFCTSFVEQLNGDVPGIVGPYSLLTVIEEDSKASTMESSNNLEKTIISVNTRLVKELIDRLVLPMTHFSPNLRFHGPPGVGKTFSLKAVQKECRNSCQIKIHELNLVDLLCMNEPLRYLEEFFLEASTFKPQLKTNDRFSNSVTNTVTNSVTKSTKKSPIIYTPLSKTRMSLNVSSPPSSSNSRLSLKSELNNPTSNRYSFNNPNLTPSKSTAYRDSFYLSATNTPQSTDNIISDELDLIEQIPTLSVVLIDELDALGKSGSQSSIQTCIVSYLCRWLDSRHSLPPSNGIYSRLFHCCIVGTTNRVQDIDSRLRCAHRLEREMEVLITREDRINLLESLIIASLKLLLDTAHLSIEDVRHNVQNVVDRLGGYVSADLSALVSEIGSLMVADVLDSTPSSSPMNTKEILFANIEKAMTIVPPSALRGVSIIVPSLTFDDIIGYEDIKTSIRRILVFANPAKRCVVAQFGLKHSGGVLLYGPPGNAKTKLVAATAHSFGLPMISLSAADVYSPYFGEAEAEIRKSFRLARQSAPCILFMDEIDALVTNRGYGSGKSEEGASAESRVLATLLNELDGVGGGNHAYRNAEEVFVFGTTNRIEDIDAALLRKGRFHHVLYVGPPGIDDAIKLVHHFGSKFSLTNESIQHITEKINHMFQQKSVLPASSLETSLSGADIENLCREEAMKWIKHKIQSVSSVTT